MMKLFPFMVLLFGLPAAAKNYPLRSLDELDFQKTISRSGNLTEHGFQDQKTGTTLLYVYDSKNRLLSIEEKNGLGQQTLKTRFLKNRLWKLSGDRLDEWLIKPSGRGIHRISYLSGRPKTIEVPFKPNFDSDVCENNIPGSQKFAENIIQTLDKTQPDTLGKSTVKTKGCDQYPGGKDGLLKEMQEAVNIGTECLIGKSPESKLEAVKLLAIFDNPKTQVNLFCGSTDQEIKLSDGDTEKLGSNTIARALVPPRDQSPGMMINLNNMDKDANERKRTLFHEMLHWLGILHSESFETPYISEICCIPEEKDSPKTKKACDLLSLSPRPELDSKAYLNAFTDLMMLDYRSFIAMDQISKTTLEKVQKPPINLSAEFEASQKLREYGNLNSKVHVEVLKKLDPSLKESAGFIKDETPIGKAATFTGDLVVLMVEKKSYKEFVKSASAIKQNYKALLTECKTEEEKTELRENIQSWLDHYSLLSFDVPDPMELNQKYAYQIWENLAKDL